MICGHYDAQMLEAARHSLQQRCLQHNRMTCFIVVCVCVCVLDVDHILLNIHCCNVCAYRIAREFDGDSNLIV